MKGCHSSAFNRDFADNSCVENPGGSWVQCDNGAWVNRWSDPTACSAQYPLTSTGKGCYSETLGREVVDNACVQSRSNGLWYQCANGSWVDRWSDPTACDGVHPL